MIQTAIAEYLTSLEDIENGVDRFTALLDDEHKTLCMVPVPAERLEWFSAEKQKQSDALNALENQRRDMAVKLCSGHDVPDAELAAELGAHERWVSLTQKIARLKQRNRENGATIMTRLTLTESRLNRLMPPSTNGLYDATGQSTARPVSGRRRVDA